MKDYRRFKWNYGYLGILLLGGLLGCDNNSAHQGYTYQGEALGTSYQIKLFHSQKIPMEKALDSIFEVINNSMSTYQSDSDISRINSGDSAVVVDKNFQQVFRYSDSIYRISNGYFDPTVGNLVNAYGFGPDKQLDSLSRSERDSLMRYVGFNKLSLTKDNRIIKEHSGVYLDFNAIAKGFSVDVIARYLDSQQVRDYLIELGGELVAKGENRQKNQPWIVGIDDPVSLAGERNLKAAIKLQNRAMATSGNYRKFRKDEATGQLFVHTINPLTGKSERSNLLSVSVLAPNCAVADAYATAFMALGFEKSVKTLDRTEDIDVYFMYSGEDNQVELYTSDGFEEVLVKD